LDASKITSGRFPVSRLPDGTSGYVLVGQGSGYDMAWKDISGIAGVITDSQHGTKTGIPFAHHGDWGHYGKIPTSAPTGAAERAYVDSANLYVHDGTSWILRATKDWNSLINKPSTFPPSAHASSHEYGGSDLVRNLDYLAIRGTTVIDSSRNLVGLASVAQSLVPDTNLTRNLGSSIKHFSTIFCNMINRSDGTLSVVAYDTLYLGSGGTIVWYMSSGGHLYPFADNAYNIGASSLRPAKIYAVSTNWGEVGFSDTICRKCGEPFKVGDELALKVIEAEAGYIETVPVHRDCREKAFSPLAEGEYEVIDEAMLDAEYMQLNVRFWDETFAAIPVKIDASDEEVQETIRKYHDKIKVEKEKKEKAVKQGESKKKVSWKGRKGKLKPA
jgi:hypothetical protein